MTRPSPPPAAATPRGSRPGGWPARPPSAAAAPPSPGRGPAAATRPVAACAAARGVALKLGGGALTGTRSSPGRGVPRPRHDGAGAHLGTTSSRIRPRRRRLLGVPRRRGRRAVGQGRVPRDGRGPGGRGSASPACSRARARADLGLRPRWIQADLRRHPPRRRLPRGGHDPGARAPIRSPAASSQRSSPQPRGAHPAGGRRDPGTGRPPSCCWRPSGPTCSRRGPR